MAYSKSKSNNKIISLNQNLKSEIFGQDLIIDALTNALSIHYAGLGDETKPIGSFLFTGPTGVGKTELAKSLAKHLEMNFVRFDMSEYMSERSADTLFGGAAGLVGYENGGLLTNAIMDEPYSVLLLDEIEKADPKVLNIFLQVLDYGILTSTKGDKVSFHNCIIICTSNLGAVATTKRTMGFNSTIYEEKQSSVEGFLAPELRARINMQLEFNSLTDEMMQMIANKYLSKIALKMKKSQISLQWDDAVLEYIASLSKEGLGSRGIQNIINAKITQVAAQMILSANVSKIILKIEESAIVIEKFENKQEYKNQDLCHNNDYFPTAEEAYAYARAHIGTTIIRANDGVGFTIKK
jgi:ATP-dependent Clp protease ATP-binding subunit ClpA